MKITDKELVTDLDERVLWIGEDDAGNVIATAASDLLCVISRLNGSVAVRRCADDSLYKVFLGGDLVRAVESGTETILELPDHRTIVLPIPSPEIFAYSYLRQSRVLYILGLHNWLSCRLSDQPEIRVYSLGELPVIPQYQRIETSSEGVVICEYGLIICPNEGSPVVFDPVRYPYSQAAFLSKDSVIAALENRAIHFIHTKRGVVDEIPAPPGSVYFLAKFGNSAVMLWEDDNPDLGAKKLYGARIVGRDCQPICFGHVWAEAFAVVPEEESVFIGTLNGLIRWSVCRGVFDTADMPNQERVVKLFWSRSMQKLFIGCRHGEVYALRLGKE